MRLISRLAGLIGGAAVLIGLTGCASNGKVAYSTAEGDITRGQVIEEIKKVVADARELEDDGEDGQARELLMEKASALGDKLGDSDAGYVLSQAVDEVATKPNDRAVEFLKGRMETAIEALKFEANVSAELPSGWPEPSMVGLVRLKEYPSVRMVKAEGSSEGETFGVLFEHIKERDIPMTAPVQLDYEMAGEEQMRQEAMSFYYPSSQVGSTGEANEAVVFDSEPVTVVSVAARGGYNEGTYAPAVGKLKDWLSRHEDYQAAGGVRVLGYNGPFTPWFMKYSEVQIPVRKAR